MNRKSSATNQTLNCENAFREGEATAEPRAAFGENSSRICHAQSA